MKKLLSTAICFSLLSINLASFAAESKMQPQAQPVKLNLVSVPLQSTLQNKYAAYRIDYINEGQNPLRIVSTVCYNKITKPDTTGDALKYSKSDKKLLMLSPFTFGITGMMYSWKKLGNMSDMGPAMMEAQSFDAYGTPVATKDLGRYEIMGSGGVTQLKVLVPINEQPQVTGTFEDIVTHQYVKVQN